jgi:hypothetical protein
MLQFEWERDKSFAVISGGVSEVKADPDAVCCVFQYQHAFGEHVLLPLWGWV